MKSAVNFLKRDWRSLLWFVLTVSVLAGEAPAESVEAYHYLETVRKGDSITIAGRFDQKEVAKTITIDADPWFQSTSLSMRRFVRSGLNELYFWTIRPDTLKAYKLVAKRKGVQDIQVNGSSETAVMVELHLTDILSAFWKSAYWFRQNDGLFLKFEGPSGPPGDPPMHVEFQGSAAPCDHSVIAA